MLEVLATAQNRVFGRFTVVWGGDGSHRGARGRTCRGPLAAARRADVQLAAGVELPALRRWPVAVEHRHVDAAHRAAPIGAEADRLGRGARSRHSARLPADPAVGDVGRAPCRPLRQLAAPGVDAGRVRGSAFTLWAVVATDVVTVGMVYALYFATGLVVAVDMPTRQAFYLEMVGREDLTNAMSLNTATFTGSRILRAALGGAIVAWVGLAPLPPNSLEHRCRRVAPGVGDKCSPVRLCACCGRFPHRDVRHEMVRCCSVPVPFPRRCVDRVSRMDLDDLTTTGLDQAAPLGDVQCLSDRVSMPSCAGTGA